MNTLADRVTSRMTDLGIGSEEALSKKMLQQSSVTISQVAIHKIKSGKTLKPRDIVALAKALECIPEWLSSGKGPQQPESQGLITTEQTVVATNVSEPPEGYSVVRPCPIVSWVQAGDWQEIIDHDQGTMICPAKHSENTYILKVQGESMMPDYHDGDYIFVDPNEQPKHNDDIVVRIDDSNTATFKRLQIVEDKKFIKPANPAWPEQIIEINGNATICGVVIFVGRSTR